MQPLIERDRNFIIGIKLKINQVNTQSYKTVSANDATVTKEWVLIDATDQVLGRLAVKTAFMLRGKHKPNYTPHVDCGDNVIIINAEKIRLTGKKMEDKIYTRHSGYPGGITEETAKDLLKRKPLALVEHAVKGMLPKTRLGSELFRNLYVYEGAEHPHQAQQPKQIYLNEN